MKKVPHVVYLLMCGSEVVYVGCTSNLERRLKCHKGKVYTSVIEFPVDHKYEGLFWERRWLLFFAPKYNWMPDWCVRQVPARDIARSMGRLSIVV